MNCKTCNVELIKENKAFYKKDGVEYFRRNCRECHLKNQRAKRAAANPVKPKLAEVYYKGMACIPEFSHCKKCNCELTEETRYFKVQKYVNKPNKLTSSSLCREHKNEDLREKKRNNPTKYIRKTKPKKNKEPKKCAECKIVLTTDNAYYSTRKNKDGKDTISFHKQCSDCFKKEQRLKRPKKVKTKKEKIVTLKKKLHKENVDPIVIEEPIIITPSRRLTGREQAMRVFAEQEARRNRTQKEINDEKNRFFDMGMMICR